MNLLPILFVLGALAQAAPAQSQANAAAIPSATSLPSRACCHVPSGTPLDLELVDPLSSKLQKRGDTFHIKLSTALELNGKLLLPAGVDGVGEIIDAQPSQGGGAPGKILVAARYLTWNGTKIPLRGTKLGGAGKSNTQAAMAAGIAIGPFGMFIHGGNIGYAQGTHFEAKLAVDTLLAPLANQTPAATTPLPAVASPPDLHAAMPEPNNVPDAQAPPSNSAVTIDHSQE